MLVSLALAFRIAVTVHRGKQLRVSTTILQAVLALFLGGVSARGEPSVGYFTDEVIAKFLPDGRNMRLEQPFAYVDPSGRRWDVPAGIETDGASIPRVLWIAYPPFTGKYRSAAVVHDYFCQTKSRGWKETHQTFYFAMRAAGVDDRTAKVMYAAVYEFGPRWGEGERKAGPGRELRTEEQTSLFDEIRAWIEAESPGLGEINRRLDWVAQYSTLATAASLSLSAIQRTNTRRNYKIPEMTPLRWPQR
jgi:hypothetical protein